MPAFSRDLERTLQAALAIAGERHTQATPLHLALALSENVFVGELLQACAVDPERLRARLRQTVGPMLAQQGSQRMAEPNAAFNRVIQRAITTAQTSGRYNLGPPHMFFALLDEPDDALAYVLQGSGVTKYDVVRYIAHGLRKKAVGSDLTGAPDSPCAVRLLNDDFTPMAFVVSVLRTTFDHTETAAVRIMLDVHTRGIAECGIYPRNIAAAKMAVLENLAREQQHPLHCVLKPREV